MGRFSTYLLLIVAIFPNFSYAKVSLSKALQETINVNLKLIGDLAGEYSFSGPVNAVLEADSDLPNSKCKTSFLFRKVKVKEKSMVEAWPTFICSFEGQKSTFKLHRVFLSLDLETQKSTFTSIGKNIQNLVLEFHDLSLRKGK